MLQTTAAPRWDTITIVVVLPGHQTLSYSPAVEEYEKLIISLENLITRHRHLPKRELASTPSETAGPVSQSSLLDAAAHSHHHGHQHDHLHDQLHGRGVGNQGYAAVTSGAAASVAVGILAESTTDTAAIGATIGDEQLTAIATELGDNPKDQSARFNANPLPHADGQEPYSFFDEANAMAAVPGSLLADAMSQTTPASSPSVAGANKGTQSISQQQYSAAGRVSPFGKWRSSSSAVLVSCSLWVLSIIVLCQ